MEALHIAKFEFTRNSELEFMHPGRTANLIINGKDAGYFGENTHIIIEADDSALNYNADAAIKIEFKVENPSTGHSNEMNITSKFKDGVAIIPISEIGFTDSCQFLLTFRAKGTVTIKNIDMAKAKGQSALEPTPGEEEKPGSGEKPEPEDSGLLSKAADLDWGTPVSVAGSSFASATDDSSIKITYVSNADNDNHKFKMMCGDGNENELFAGEATGFTIDKTSENENDLHGCDFAAAPSETPAVITYKPSPAEWTKIKAGEFRLIGHGAKITKIELGTDAPGREEGGDSVVFDDAISAVELSPNNWNKKDNGIQYHVAKASLFPDGIEAGDKYKFEMTGSVTGGPITQKFIIVIDNGDSYNPNKVQNYFVNDPSVSGKSAEECLSEGITVTMTFDAAIESSKVVLWIYTEGPGTDYDAETTASKTATIDFSSFKITKVE